MTPIAAKLARQDIAPPQAEELPTASGGSALPIVAIVSVALHGLIALALVSLPLPACLGPALDMTWVDFELTSMPAAAPEIVRPEPEVVPPEPLAPPPVVRRDRPQPIADVEPDIAPVADIASIVAPPSIDEAFAEPPPPAAVLTGEGASAFSMAPGELGGVPGGVPGGHGTSLVSTVRPAPVAVGPSDADRRRARRSYVHAIEELVRTHARYPRAAAREGLQGRVELGLRIGTDGHVLAIRIATSSGSPLLDDAATDAAREIDRVPTPPAIASLTPSDEVRVGVVYLVR